MKKNKLAFISCIITAVFVLAEVLIILFQQTAVNILYSIAGGYAPVSLFRMCPPEFFFYLICAFVIIGADIGLIKGRRPPAVILSVFVILTVYFSIPIVGNTYLTGILPKEYSETYTVEYYISLRKIICFFASVLIVSAILTAGAALAGRNAAYSRIASVTGTALTGLYIIICVLIVVFRINGGLMKKSDEFVFPMSSVFGIVCAAAVIAGGILLMSKNTGYVSAVISGAAVTAYFCGDPSVTLKEEIFASKIKGSEYFAQLAILSSFCHIAAILFIAGAAVIFIQSVLKINEENKIIINRKEDLI